MNTQPYQTPSQWWPPKMNPWLVWFGALHRKTALAQQKIVEIEVRGLDRLKALIAANTGLLVTPNHSFHYDSYCLNHAAAQASRPFHYMTAWQVFAAGSAYERWWLQLHGCFSVDREGSDIRAFKQAVDILQTSAYPLVIFPEGDIYHTNERVRQFRDGAAAIALASARRTDRRIACVPCAIKANFLDDPTPRLCELLETLERRLNWRPRPDLPMSDRLYRLADGILSLKELEYLGHPSRGTVPARTASLAEAILQRLEQLHGVTTLAGIVPERVKELRRRIILKREKPGDTPADTAALNTDMEDLFFVIQLYSYPGDYVSERPSVERMAETLDKLEEDILNATYPSVRARRKATVSFGEPIAISKEKAQQPSTEALTNQLQAAVQGLLDGVRVPA